MLGSIIARTTESCKFDPWFDTALLLKVRRCYLVPEPLKILFDDVFGRMILLIAHRCRKCLFLAFIEAEI